MRKKSSWLPHALLLAAVLLVTLTVLLLIDKPREQRHQDILERVAPLERERDRLALERDALQQNYLQQKDHPATEQFLFLELDPRLYSSAFPQIRKAGLTACMGLRDGFFPGDPGCISRAQFDEMLEAGWDCCLVYAGQEDFSDWDRKLTGRLEKEGLEKPATVYFERNCFDESMTEEILRCGYSIAIHHGEGGLSLIGKDSNDELWLVGAHPWNYEGVKVDIQEMIRFRGDTCFTVKFSRGGEEYGTGAFAAMLEFVSSYLRDGSLKITGFDEARENHRIRIEGMEMSEEEFQRQKAELDEQILALNEQIQEMYDEWNDGKDD